MSTPEAQRTLIDEIDDRQEALLNDLTSLNARVETLLEECLAARERQRLAEEADSEDNSDQQDRAAPEASLDGPNVLISQSPAVASVPQEC